MAKEDVIYVCVCVCTYVHVYTYTHIMEYYSATKKKTMSFVATLKDGLRSDHTE